MNFDLSKKKEPLIKKSSKHIVVPPQKNNVIHKDEEYEQNKKLFKQQYASVILIPPKHTGIPCNVAGTISGVNEKDDLYSVQLMDGRIVLNIPINYLRSDQILCSGKHVVRVSA